MKSFIYLLGVLIIINACKEKEIKRNCNDIKGGTIKMAFQEKISSLFPSSLNNISSLNIANFIHCGLVRYNSETMDVIPCVAKRWESDTSFTAYTFYLNTNVYFNDDKCFSGTNDKKVKAQDVYFSFKLLCTKKPNNYYYDILYNEIQGVDQFEKNNFEGEISGIKVINDSTISFKLKKPNPLFVFSIASPVFSIISEKAYNTYSHSLSVGAGPFYIYRFEDKNSPFILLKNEKFFMNDKQNNCLPYLDTVIIYTGVSLKEQLEMLKNSKLDVVLNIDDETLTEFMEKNIKLFSGEKPLLKVISANLTNANFPYKYIINSRIENFYINSQNLIDIITTKLIRKIK